MTPPPGTAKKRIQRRRTKGWRMPEGAIYVGRPTAFGNDWSMHDAFIRGIRDEREQRAWAVREYRNDLLNWLQNPSFAAKVATLRGKDLVCWCPVDQPCHADVLLKLLEPLQRPAHA